MAKYQVLTPVKTSDGIIHKPNEIIELTDQEAKNCLSFKAVASVFETAKSTKPVVTPAVQPTQPIATPIQQQKNTVQAQESPATSPKPAPVEDNVVPPESDVR
jgi:hypothetical protein